MENETQETTQQPPEITVPPMVEVQHISKRFPGVVALDDVSLQFFPGETHAVVGENGAGKSTLMKILSGAYTPDSGTIFLNGEKVAFYHPREAQERASASSTRNSTCCLNAPWRIIFSSAVNRPASGPWISAR